MSLRLGRVTNVLVLLLKLILSIVRSDRVYLLSISKLSSVANNRTLLDIQGNKISFSLGISMRPCIRREDYRARNYIYNYI